MVNSHLPGEAVIERLQPTKKIWFDGKFVPWDEAKIHVLTHALHYGYAIFEGIRCNNTPDGPAVFSLREHIERLFNSAKVYRMQLPYTEGAAHPRLPRPRKGERPEGLLHPPDRLQLIRRDGRKPSQEQGRRRNRGLGVGLLSGRRGDGERHTVHRLELGAG